MTESVVVEDSDSIESSMYTLRVLRGPFRVDSEATFWSLMGAAIRDGLYMYRDESGICHTVAFRNRRLENNDLDN